jgi:hypothetical protein
MRSSRAYSGLKESNKKTFLGVSNAKEGSGEDVLLLQSGLYQNLSIRHFGLRRTGQWNAGRQFGQCAAGLGG